MNATVGVRVEKHRPDVFLTVDLGSEQQEVARVTLTPETARRLAQRLLQAADHIEAREQK